MVAKLRLFSALCALVAAVVMVAAELPSVKWLDDDLLMQLVPVAVLLLLAALPPAALPDSPQSLRSRVRRGRSSSAPGGSMGELRS